MRIARTCMWLAIVIWAIWFGGQTYHALTVIPMWNVNPPETLHAYAALGEKADSIPFFLVFSTVWPTLLASIAFFAARRLPWRDRKWIAAFAVGALAVSLSLILWMAPMIWSIFTRQYASAAEGAARFSTWRTANHIRLVCEFALFLVGVQALTRMSQGRALPAD